jgi:signal transduction histidine kinase
VGDRPGGLTYVFWDWALPHNPDNYELPELLGFADTPTNRISFYLIVGIVFTVTLPFVVRGCALVEAWLGRALLTGVAGLRDQVAGLTQDRATARAQTAAAVSAEATALRRLERDIHDGPQQRLVRLAVDLGRAKQQLDGDPDAARRTVDEAITQTREALDELRTLSRGIAPPILTDRGWPRRSRHSRLGLRSLSRSRSPSSTGCPPWPSRPRTSRSRRH